MLDLFARLLHRHSCDGNVLLTIGQESDLFRDWSLSVRWFFLSTNVKLTFDQEEWRNQTCHYGRNAFDDEDLVALSQRTGRAYTPPTQRQPWLYMPSPTLMSDKAYANYEKLIYRTLVEGLRDSRSVRNLRPTTPPCRRSTLASLSRTVDTKTR